MYGISHAYRVAITQARLADIGLQTNVFNQKCVWCGAVNVA